MTIELKILIMNDYKFNDNFKTYVNFFAHDIQGSSIIRGKPKLTVAHVEFV